MVLRGSSDDDPSPVNRAWRNARLKAPRARHTDSGTRFSLAFPWTSPSGLRRSAPRFWMSSSNSWLPEAIRRVDR